MTAQMRLTSWRGPEVLKQVETAQKNGIESVMGDCVREAMGRARVDTSTMQGSFRYEMPVRRGSLVVGTWGSFDVNYTVHHEFGTIYMSAQPMLRPAADIYYPQLAERIRTWMVK